MEDLRATASVVKGHKVKEGVQAILVPGSMTEKNKQKEFQIFS